MAICSPAAGAGRGGTARDLAQRLLHERPGPAAGVSVFGDWDLDGDVDLLDYLQLQACLVASGPGILPPEDCHVFWAGGFPYIDLTSVRIFELTFTGTLVICGNGDIEGLEQCDDGNTMSGDGCSETCRIEASPLDNDYCSDPSDVSDGVTIFTNVGANTDGPDGGSSCDFFGRSQIESDVWFCYTATCTGEVTASLCGSEYDTKMAVYTGCDCPSEGTDPLDCSDDDCGSMVESTQSRVTWEAIKGEKYMIRIGGFIGEQGDGRLGIRCGAPDACTSSTNDCEAESADGTPGCADVDCCSDVCDVDQSCCDFEWDDFCAAVAEGVCDDQFAVCGPGSGPCESGDGTPGCSNVNCCNTVCRRDPYCCITEWDDNCGDEGVAFCGLTCNVRAGDCFTVHDSPGCNSVTCCQILCSQDPFCCDTEWDASCVSEAIQMCK